METLIVTIVVDLALLPERDQGAPRGVRRAEETELKVERQRTPGSTHLGRAGFEPPIHLPLLAEGVLLPRPLSLDDAGRDEDRLVLLDTTEVWMAEGLGGRRSAGLEGCQELTEEVARQGISDGGEVLLDGGGVPRVVGGPLGDLGGILGGGAAEEVLSTREHLVHQKAESPDVGPLRRGVQVVRKEVRGEGLVALPVEASSAPHDDELFHAVVPDHAAGTDLRPKVRVRIESSHQRVGAFPLVDSPQERLDLMQDDDRILGRTLQEIVDTGVVHDGSPVSAVLHGSREVDRGKHLGGERGDVEGAGGHSARGEEGGGVMTAAASVGGGGKWGGGLQAREEEVTVEAYEGREGQVAVGHLVGVKHGNRPGHLPGTFLQEVLPPAPDHTVDGPLVRQDVLQIPIPHGHDRRVPVAEIVQRPRQMLLLSHARQLPITKERRVPWSFLLGPDQIGREGAQHGNGPRRGAGR
mmetsp:Transcript_8086/g.24109  ORF Transcript_8086/g.24109 Transcript_8086/m.24109 type:complete len:468 (-) Transcript_8086:600-2003(-)